MHIRKLLGAALLAGLLAAPAFAGPHSYTGTVESIDGNTVWISTSNGQAYAVPYGKTTTFTLGGTSLGYTNLQPGMPIVIGSPTVYQAVPVAKVPHRYHGPHHDMHYWSDKHHWHNYHDH